MIDLIFSSKIHFNKNISVDMNYRIFETIGLGTCLITDYDETLYELGFIEDYNILTYKNYEECVIKITKCLKNNTWKEIGERGFKISKENTHACRIKKLMEQI